jgi:hydrophobic/amphiphilic exporter-1 (mainly G- bacteria), HAE1 family
MTIIRTFLRNPVAANMLMIIILGGGLVAGTLVPRELFPEFTLDFVTISVPYPGAAPDDIEQGICLKIEDYVRNVEGIKEITSESREGLGTVTLELYGGSDVRKVLDEVQSEVDKIEFPANAEDPVVREVTRRIHVVQVAVFGQASERTLKEIAQDIKDELTQLPDISQAEVTGVRDYEISIEIDEETLRRYGLTMGEVARRVRDNSFDLPAGRVRTQTGEYALRIVGQKYTAAEYEEIPIVSLAAGTVLRLRDVATVREAFEDVDRAGLFNGEPAAVVSVYKTGDEDIIRIAKRVRGFIAQKQPQLPEGIRLAVWSDLSKTVADRLDLLIRNGTQGLVLVVLVLWLFLGLRLSFWVALGIPISIFGTLMVMYMTGQTLNVLSMFGLIMALGLIVDDAIVVGENVFARFEKGDRPDVAALDGTRMVTFPVVGAVMTTWLAFAPLFFIEGTMGKFISQLPGVVILTLAFSLVECLLILPAHLKHSLSNRLALAEGVRTGWRGAIRRRSQAVRDRLDRSIAWFIDTAFMGLYRRATRLRYVSVAICIALLLVMVGALRGGFIPLTIFPKVESDTIKAAVKLPTGTPFERTEQVVRELTRSAKQLNEQFTTATGEPLVLRVYSLLGQQSGRSGGDSGGHVGEVVVELLPTEKRGPRLRSEVITSQWRKNAQRPPEALSWTFGAFRGGPGGTPLEVRVLADSTDQAKAIAEKVKQRLATFDGVFDIEDDALPGKRELRIVPTRAAYTLGVDQQILAAQLRDAFYGNESIEIQRGRDEVKVMVRYPEGRRRSLSNVEDKRIRLPDGSEIPFTELADVSIERGYTTLRRVGGKSVVTVQADVDEDVANAEQILTALQGEGFFAQAVEGVPGASVDLRGQRQQRTESLGSLRVWFPVALLGVYTILATIFRSYLQPIIVMVAIPFGLIGATIGHWVLGFDVTLLSMFGMVALSGIVVNDSLVLIDMVNNRVREGDGIVAAVAEGARARFRPILLTTVTTVAGMTPLLAEQSFQAQFLKPMAVSITFGLSFATLLTLLVVPCLYLIGNDIRRGWHWVWTGELPPAELVSQHHPMTADEE